MFPTSIKGAESDSPTHLLANAAELRSKARKTCARAAGSQHNTQMPGMLAWIFMMQLYSVRAS
jgi:hypothetical protein